MAWTNDVLSMDLMSGVVVDGFIYGFGLRDFQTRSEGGTEGAFKCVKLATGEECWNSLVPGCAQALACGDRLLMLSESGNLIAAVADPTRYRELARWPLFPGRTCWTAPALCGEMLLARSRDEFVGVHLGDPAGLAAQAAPGGGLDLRPWARFSGWFESHYSNAFYAPTWADHTRWYVACVVALLLPAGLLCASWVGSRSWQPWAAFGISVLIPFGATWWLTGATGRFIFTWPAAVFVLFFGTVLCRSWALSAPGRTRQSLARLTLVGLLALAAGYWQVCRSLFLIAGSAYLVGLLPALPFTVRAAQLALRRETRARAWTTGIVAFTIFYWTAAVFLWWRVHH